MAIVGWAAHAGDQNDTASRIMMKADIRNFIINTSMNMQLKPRQWDINTLQMYNPQANIPLCMEVICELIFEFYGLNPWEYRNNKKLEQVWMSQEHKNTIDKRYDVDSKITEFVNSKYGDEYKKSHWVPLETDNEMNVVDVPAHLVNQDLNHFEIKTWVEPESLNPKSILKQA